MSAIDMFWCSSERACVVLAHLWDRWRSVRGTRCCCGAEGVWMIRVACSRSAGVPHCPWCSSPADVIRPPPNWTPVVRLFAVLLPIHASSSSSEPSDPVFFCWARACHCWRGSRCCIERVRWLYFLQVNDLPNILLMRRLLLKRGKRHRRIQPSRDPVHLIYNANLGATIKNAMSVMGIIGLILCFSFVCFHPLHP